MESTVGRMVFGIDKNFPKNGWIFRELMFYIKVTYYIYDSEGMYYDQ